LNAASFQAGALSPGEILSIFGSNIGPLDGSTFILDGRYSTFVGGTTVRFNGVAAPILYANMNQVNAVVPYPVNGQGSVDIVLSTPNGATRIAHEAG
jgi:uncharacterized protein (TIGR03437 family)